MEKLYENQHALENFNQRRSKPHPPLILQFTNIRHMAILNMHNDVILLPYYLAQLSQARQW